MIINTLSVYILFAFYLLFLLRFSMVDKKHYFVYKNEFYLFFIYNIFIYIFYIFVLRNFVYYFFLIPLLAGYVIILIGDKINFIGVVDLSVLILSFLYIYSINFNLEISLFYVLFLLFILFINSQLLDIKKIAVMPLIFYSFLIFSFISFFYAIIL